MHKLPDLSYQYHDLEPHIDAKTMEIHHTKHHQSYVDKLNAALEKHADPQQLSLEDLLKDLSSLPEDIRTAVQNNGGGHANHSLFWSIMSPQGGDEPQDDLASAINTSFSNFDKFKDVFSQAATTRFGSGWAWLVIKNSKLIVTSTPNQDTPLMQGNTPILGLDIWEHAYYLNYQNRRPDYIKAWWDVVNWSQVQQNYQQALSK